MPQNEPSFSAPRAAPPGPSADKRARILNAAIGVFAEKGFYAARVSEIARAAGVADGTIYLYFENKDDVLLSIFRDRLGRLVALLEEELARLADPEAQVRRIVELQLGLLDGHRDLAEVVTVNLRQSSTLLKQYAAPLFERYLALIARVIEGGQRAGRFRGDLRPPIVARALWGALDGVALTWALGDAEPGALRDAANDCANVFLRGVLARQGPLGLDVRTHAWEEP